MPDQARTTISLRRPLTAKKKDVTTPPKIAAMTGIAAEMEPSARSSACVTHDAPDLPTCATKPQFVFQSHI